MRILTTAEINAEIHELLKGSIKYTLAYGNVKGFAANIPQQQVHDLEPVEEIPAAIGGGDTMPEHQLAPEGILRVASLST